MIFLTASKSSIVSTPIGANFAKATLIFMLLSNALSCSSLFLISLVDCFKETNFSRVSLSYEYIPR